MLATEQIVIGDLVLLELLQGAVNNEKASRIEVELRAFTIEAMLDARLAVQAARHYRTMRAAGRTIRKTVNLIIGTFCIDRGYALLHNNRDFEPMHEHLGLLRAPLSLP